MSRLARTTGVATLVLVLGGSAGVARGQELHGRVRETYQSLSDDFREERVVLQNYEINFKNDITQTLFWQTRLRALLTGLDGRQVAGSDTFLVEPFFQIVYAGPIWEASGGARLTRITPKGEQSTALETKREDLFGRVAWARENLPRVDWSVYSIHLESDSVSTSDEDRSLVTTTWARGPGALSFGLENRWFTDPRTDFTRDSIQASGNGDLQLSFMDGRLNVGGQALAVRGRVDEKTPNAVQVDSLRRPRNGLYAQDTTPLVGTLADTPALIDGDLTSAAADLSGDFRNIGVDLGFAEDIDTAFVYIERRLLPGNERDYSWDVYTSTDGDFWALLTISAGSSFDGLLNRFEIRFPSTNTRWLKVVNTNFRRNEPPLAATEIQVTGQETRSGEESRSQSLGSATVNLAWQATRIVDLGFIAFGNRQANDTGQGRRVDEDLNATLTTSVRPGRTATTVRLQAINRSTSQSPSEADRIAAVTFAVTPMPDLDLSVTGSHRRNTTPSALLVEADSLSFRGAVRLSGDTDLALDLGGLRQEEGVIGRVTRREHALLTLVTTLRPGLFLSNNWNVERIRFTGVGPAELANRTDIDLRTRLSYRPTQVLGAAAEVLYQDIAGDSGFSRLLELDWLPFAGGSLQVQLSAVQDRRSVTGSFRDETRAGVRWSLNPRTLLDAAYTILETGGANLSNRQRIFSVFLEYRF